MAEMKGRRLHFIAIGGAGMSGLALVAKQLGAEVSGSDRAESSYMERLRAAGIEPELGHDADQVPPRNGSQMSTGAQISYKSAIQSFKADCSFGQVPSSRHHKFSSLALPGREEARPGQQQRHERQAAGRGSARDRGRAGGQ